VWVLGILWALHTVSRRPSHQWLPPVSEPLERKRSCLHQAVSQQHDLGPYARLCFRGSGDRIWRSWGWSKWACDLYRSEELLLGRDGEQGTPDMMLEP
jgi:hypothetical protein